jgi:large subunit ribosomal protein L6
MSRIGNKAIKLHDGVTVTVGEENLVLVSGPKGQIEFKFNPDIEIKVEENVVHVHRPSDSLEHRALHGTTRAILHNMIEGVVTGFSKTLLIEGVGYRAQLQGNNLVINAGYSHLVEMPIPAGLTVKVPSPTEINISGIDKQAVGQFAAEVRLVRKPEPYKGKGIRYKDEVIRRKEGKKAK